AWATAVLTDGRIVVAGTADANLPAVSAIYVARLESDGDLDPTFNMTRVVTTSIGLGSVGYGVDLQADGKIVVAGASTSPATNADFTLVRYNADGSLDATFGVTGVVTTAITTGEDTAFAVRLQPDGKIVAAGRSNDGTLTNLVAVARYESDGQLDTSFGNGGVYTKQIGTVSQALGVEVQSDGKIVLTGSSGGPGFPPVQTIMVSRLNSDGSLDSGFGMTGVVTTQVSLGDSTATDITIDAGGSILVSGTGFRPGGSEFAVVRYAGDGSLDFTFGVSGVVTTDIAGGYDDASWLDLQSDGKIVVGGAAFDLIFSQGDMAIARYLGGPAIGLTEKIYLPNIIK
ncbi:MAG: hypothetical protein R3335_07285, partial [Anaerolineales bacterium]|nr:hypothetical protein [Anaerolineales bacterium]